MKLKFKHQDFQKAAAKSVVDVFKGQTYSQSSYLIDTGVGPYQGTLTGEDTIGCSNNKLIPSLTYDVLLDNLNKVQKRNGLEPSSELDVDNGTYNLTIEMETGTGKTYTYIKTMYELNKHYGWCKFIVVVPSIAIREGVYKSFEITQEHFAEEYGKKIRYFIYDSKNLQKIRSFASDSNINVMIINSQAFNATGKDARRIHMKLDELNSCKPIDLIAQTNPILIIDEPQSVEGEKTKEQLKRFKPLFTLRYSATHKFEYNMVFRLDALDAYNKKLVKKIEVKGIEQRGTTATNGYVYLDKINVSKSDPTANINIDYRTKNGTKKVLKKVEHGDNLYDISNELQEYKDGYVITAINAKEDYIEFINGIRLKHGEVVGDVSEDSFRRIQINETIKSHIEKERKLFYSGIKVLSLFFIDEVAKYKQYDEAGQPLNGDYANMFEEEYDKVIQSLQPKMGEDDYFNYLKEIRTQKTHAGYFSIDKKGKLVNSKLSGKKDEKHCDDIDAYDLIMRDKEKLLDQNPTNSPVRFIFSHSALKEGWDNPNVFQICTLKQSGSETRKRQEVGRGLRLCVNQNGERQDENVLGQRFDDVNKLTVIASESYETFAKGLQSELCEVIKDRPVKVNFDLFVGETLVDNEGDKVTIDEDLANEIKHSMIKNDYIDVKGVLKEKYFEDKKNNKFKTLDTLTVYAPSIIKILDSMASQSIKIENARSNNVELIVDEEKLYSKEFQSLWKKINKKTYYRVDFDTKELITNAINALNDKLHVTKITYEIRTGEMKDIKSKKELAEGSSFKNKAINRESIQIYSNDSVKYDLIGEIVKETGLTRKAVVSILKGIQSTTFDQFKFNPEDFISKASKIINEEKATAIVQHITYNPLNESYDTTIFTEPSIKGKLDVNARRTEKHLYDYLVYDSSNEKKFSEELDIDNEVAVYVKLPSGFYISTPVGKYNPDWAIAFQEGSVKHIYFVAETKGSMSTMDLREIEKSKIHCATEHFRAISGDDIQYHVVDSYRNLLDLIH